MAAQAIIIALSESDRAAQCGGCLPPKKHPKTTFFRSNVLKNFRKIASILSMIKKTALWGKTRPISHVNSDSLFYYRRNFANSPTLHLFSGDISVHKAAWMPLFLTFTIDTIHFTYNLEFWRLL